MNLLQIYIIDQLKENNILISLIRLSYFLKEATANQI